MIFAFTGIMLAAVNTLKLAEEETVERLHHLLPQLRVLQGEGCRRVGAAQISPVIRCQAGIYLLR